MLELSQQVIPLELSICYINDMPSLLIKDLPADLHKRLREAAERHRRSMAKEALVALERGIDSAPRPLPPPVRPTVPMTQAWLTRAIRRGRA
ncbi:MAG: hypothetical protein AAB368_03130 [bacterium]